MQEFTLRPIGQIQAGEGGFAVALHAAHRAGLANLHEFSHAVLLWWCHAEDTPAARAAATVQSPYRHSRGQRGVFSTRSPARPNPIGLSVCRILAVDEAAGLVHIDYTDAWPGTPVLDVKPYTPSLDRVEAPAQPAWCAHWPPSLEASAHFDWESEVPE